MRTRIPGYELLDDLGGGPLTRVFSACEHGSAKTVVVKTIREDWPDESTAVKLIQREARAGLSVRHPRLVRIMDAHVTKAPYFIVMEMVSGESLRDLMEKCPGVDWPQAVSIIRQIANPLQSLHQAGFLHGDVKPENIRVKPDGSATLIDLGFAHRPGENVSFLADGYMLGTVNYLAPEMASFEANADGRSDLYSLGVTFYEMVTGRLPYPVGTVRETLRRHAEDRPIDPRCYVPELPTGVVHLLQQMLAPLPAERVPNALALMSRLVPLEAAETGRRRSA